MGLVKISQYEPPCQAQGHNPPTMYAYSPGIYEWTCDSCGKKVVFTVPGTTL